MFFYEHPLNRLEDLVTLSGLAQFNSGVGGKMPTLPATVIDNGRAFRVRIALPRRDGGEPLICEGECIYGDVIPQGVGALFSGKLIKGIKDTAKKIAKNKAFQAVAKTAPLWGNLIPPPAGQVIAAGSAAAMAAKKIADAAKGSKNPKVKAKAAAFVNDAKKEKAKKVVTAKAAVKVSTALKNAPAAVRKKAIQKVVAKNADIEVRFPDGSVEKVPMSKVA